MSVQKLLLAADGAAYVVNEGEKHWVLRVSTADDGEVTVVDRWTIRGWVHVAEVARLHDEEAAIDLVLPILRAEDFLQYPGATSVSRWGG